MFVRGSMKSSIRAWSSREIFSSRNRTSPNRSSGWLVLTWRRSPSVKKKYFSMSPLLKTSRPDFLPK